MKRSPITQGCVPRRHTSAAFPVPGSRVEIVKLLERGEHGCAGAQPYQMSRGGEPRQSMDGNDTDVPGRLATIAGLPSGARTF